jgi:membrane protease subunit (stomatin/prohibitin family)
MTSEKRNLLDHYLVELLKIDATIAELLDYMADTIDEPWERGDGSAYDDIHVMSLYSDQGIRNLRERILNEK